MASHLLADVREMAKGGKENVSNYEWLGGAA
jgi:hypothetical protein